jgi:hypothetical protein
LDPCVLSSRVPSPVVPIASTVTRYVPSTAMRVSSHVRVCLKPNTRSPNTS